MIKRLPFGRWQAFLCFQLPGGPTWSEAGGACSTPGRVLIPDRRYLDGEISGRPLHGIAQVYIH